MMRYIPDVVTLDLDADICTGCGMCALVCPHGVFQVANGRAEIVDRDACMECGACAKNCPVRAVSVRSGVGCATAVLSGIVSGCEPACGPSRESCCCN